MNTFNLILRRHAAALAGAAIVITHLVAPPDADAAIVARAPGMAYDTTLNVTWATDASLFDTLAGTLGGNLALAQAIYQNDPFVLAKTDTHTQPLNLPGQPRNQSAYLLVQQATISGNVVPYPDYRLQSPPGGRVTFNWYGARALVNYLNDTDYLGHNDWRLPRMLDGGCVLGVNAIGASCAGGPWNEVQSLYLSLGMQEGVDLSTSIGHNDAYKLFSGGVGKRVNWLRDESETVVVESGGLRFIENEFGWALAALESSEGTDGDTAGKDKYSYYAGLMVLRDGDTAPATEGTGPSPVPVPAPLALMASAVAVLCGARARRRASAVR